jgi:hypothetical protein
MAEVTYYVALPFVAADDGIASGEAVECFNPNVAAMRAEALSRKPATSARSPSTGPGIRRPGDFGDATVIRKLATFRTISARCDTHRVSFVNIT